MPTRRATLIRGIVDHHDPSRSRTAATRPGSARIFEAANLALRLRTLTRADAALAVLIRLIDG